MLFKDASHKKSRNFKRKLDTKDYRRKGQISRGLESRHSAEGGNFAGGSAGEKRRWEVTVALR